MACQRAPIPGGNRCHLHGGGSPQAQRKAKERLLAAADPAAAALVEIVKDGENRPADRIRAAKEILDRAGIQGESKVEVSTGIDVEGLREALQEGFENRETRASLRRGRLDSPQQPALRGCEQREVDRTLEDAKRRLMGPRRT